MKTCEELRPNALALADLLYDTDFKTGSLGAYDGDIYNRVISQTKTRPGNTERPDWWPMIY